MPTAAQLALVNPAQLVGGLIEENRSYAPEFNVFPARTVPGRNFRTLVRNTLPTGEFVPLGGGATTTESVYTARLTSCHSYKALVKVALDTERDFDQGQAGAFFSNEASGHVKNAILTMGTQTWYGTGIATDYGFQGVKALTATTASGYLVNAAGTTAATASSCYAIKFSESESDFTNASFVFGDNQVMAMTDPITQMISVVSHVDSSLTRDTLGRVSELSMQVGLQVGTLKCVGRIYNLTADSGKGLTDALLDQLWEQFPVGGKPDAFFCSSRSVRQLNVARSSTGITVINAGASQTGFGMAYGSTPGAPDTYFNGKPIYATGSILNTDVIDS